MLFLSVGRWRKESEFFCSVFDVGLGFKAFEKFVLDKVRGGRGGVGGYIVV